MKQNCLSVACYLPGYREHMSLFHWRQRYLLLMPQNSISLAVLGVIRLSVDELGNKVVRSDKICFLSHLPSDVLEYFLN